jgi:hypothetical protein
MRFLKPAKKTNNMMADMLTYINPMMTDNYVCINLCTIKDNVNADQILLESIANI